MTIRFITAWNGYRADQVVSGLGGAEETRLIGLGFAVADLDGPDNTPLPVVATTNLTGVVEKTTSAGATVSQQSCLRNFNPDKYLRSRAKLAKVLAGSGQMWVAQLGDSTTLGKYADGTNPYAGNYSKSPAAHLVARLNALGINADQDNAFYKAGDATCVFDSRLTVTAGWGGAEGTRSLSGGFYSNQTNANALTFAPTNQSDSFDVFCKAFTAQGNGPFTATLGGGTPVVCANTGNDLYKKYSGTATLGANNLVITRTSGLVLVAGFRTYNSALGRVHVQNMGWDGGKIANIASSDAVYGTTQQYAFMENDLSFIRMGLNDYTVTDVVTFKTKYAGAIDACLVTGDVILETCTPLTTTYQNPVHLPYYQAVMELAQDYDLAVIDHWRLWGYRTTEMDAVGGMYHTDDTHLLTAGNALIGGYAQANAISKLLA